MVVAVQLRGREALIGQETGHVPVHDQEIMSYLPSRTGVRRSRRQLRLLIAKSVLSVVIFFNLRVKEFSHSSFYRIFKSCISIGEVRDLFM